MPKTIQQVREHIEKARIVESMTSTEALERKRKFQDDMAEISRNRDLSDIGRENAVSKLKLQHGVEFLQDAYQLKQIYMAELRKAREGADAIVYAKPRKPDPVKLERFEDELKALKTTLMLTGRADDAKRKVEEFVTKYVKSPDDRYLALKVREDFAQIAAPILETAGVDKAKVRVQLSEIFEGLEQRTLSEEVQEAVQIIGLADSMIERNSLFPSLVTESMTTTLGREYAGFLNTPEVFFEDKEALKPEDYVHPEDTPQAKAARALEERREQENREFAERWRSLNQRIEEFRRGGE
ncbi:hypothetical protein [Brevibacillus porteri]|uniref:Uncharacterized protein n=1 Tax=Brevibacillus porteri TaxID=2126350 RepID=A0ABX5FHI6_9BACL|nr:hypothetical protein [Brevibacillus porteri]MED1802915.1 hypothetical protein [Brevibacillus porteri]MED2135091.1 hypothetical protein [Brevibacillus porteri]MED2746333.1 hypothetical protein [Brevibacillus porteri]MED2817917.1 hypothetical protein [Brevibacillus porteri]MED2895549.1 hypothetical protein [Brevibacillus porteri]